MRTYVLMLVLCTIAVVLALPSLVAPVVAPVVAPALPPCATEDSSPCTWDATVQGNGHGHSFVALWGDVVIYLP